MPEDFEPIPYRIRVGVTGHRQLEHPEVIEALVRSALDVEIEKLFPAKWIDAIEQIRSAGITPITYSVLSALAEGADRVVLRAILDHPEYPRSRLDVVLPMTVEDYLEDFKTEKSKQEFRCLLSRCRQPVMLRDRRIVDDRHDLNDQVELRRECYERAGQYVVDHCDALIAVWDGQPARGRGGTAEIVAYTCKQRLPVIRVWDGTFSLYNPSDNNGLDASALAGIDIFNRRAIAAGKLMAYIANLDRDHFEKPATGRQVSAAARELVNKYLFPFYAQASMVAKESQNRFYRAGIFT